MSADTVQQRTARPFPLSVVFLFSAAWFCASPSHAASVKSAWSDNVSHKQSFARVLVVGISPDRNVRCDFERAMASKVKSANTVAIASCDVMPPKTPFTREDIEAAVAANNADAVLVTSLISKTWELKEGGTYDTRGGAYYKATDSYYGIYGTVVAADFQTTAPITTAQGAAHVTTKLYETRGATVVYTVDTTVKNIESTGEGIIEITAPIGKKLRKDGVVR